MSRSPGVTATVLAGLAAALVAAGIVAVVVSTSAHGSTPRVASASARQFLPVPTSAPEPEAGPGGSLIATLRGPTPYSSEPGAPSSGTLPATNPFGAPEVLAVISDEGGWMHVELPVRPNGSTGWIPDSAASLTQTYYRVTVSLAARTMTVTNYGKEVLTTPVAVGSPATPTPPGNTYLWELIRPNNPNGDYGPYIFGLAEFSDSYSVFNGGDAQIGIHGQNEPWTIGRAASHGCVRTPNDVITELAGMLPLGTPVSIS